MSHRSHRLPARTIHGAHTLRVLTYNVWGTRGAWDARCPVISAGLRELQPDLIALQETIVTDHSDQVRELLTPDYHLVQQQAREADGQGVSIASRWPIGDVQEIDLRITPRSQADTFACVTLIAQIDVPEPIGPLLFINHFPSWQPSCEYDREAQAVRSAQEIEARIDRQVRHVVLAGDLDADPASASIRFWCGRQSLEGMSVCYRDAWESVHPGEPGETYTPTNPLMTEPDWPFCRIDYVFVRCRDHGGPTLTIAACERTFQRPIDGVWASDHFGLVVDLTAQQPVATSDTRTASSD